MKTERLQVPVLLLVLQVSLSLASPLRPAKHLEEDTDQAFAEVFINIFTLFTSDDI